MRERSVAGIGETTNKGGLRKRKKERSFPLRNVNDSKFPFGSSREKVGRGPVVIGEKLHSGKAYRRRDSIERHPVRLEENVFCFEIVSVNENPWETDGHYLLGKKNI